MFFEHGIFRICAPVQRVVIPSPQTIFEDTIRGRTDPLLASQLDSRFKSSDRPTPKRPDQIRTPCTVDWHTHFSGHGCIHWFDVVRPPLQLNTYSSLTLAQSVVPETSPLRRRFRRLWQDIKDLFDHARLSFI